MVLRVKVHGDSRTQRRDRGLRRGTPWFRLPATSRDVLGSYILVGAALIVLLAFGCGDEPDGIPPDRVEDLMLAGATETTATLSWTAPGDDARQGTVTRYDVRYSLKALPEDWESAVRVTELPPPREGGAAESLVVAGLANDHVYFMALTATDEAGNTSGLSNVVQVHTGDPGPPDFIADLEATEIFPHAVTLRFTAPGDDGNTGRASSYRIRYQQIELTEENWEDAVDVSPTTNPREAGQVERIRIHDLNPEGLYFFGVRSRDDAGNQSPLSNVAEVRLPPDTVAPASIRDLEVVRTSFEKVRLAWTAPGDDEDEGRATAYEARWASERITDESWNHATSVGSLPPPSEAGVREEMALFGLPGGTTIWLAVRAEDALGNRSAVSNNVFALLPSAERVWRVVEDGSGDAPTVQAAIDSAADGAAVVVGPGRYFENLDLRGKEIYLVSAFGPEATILDGTSAPSPVVSCMGLETSDTVIEGFTITGGMGYQALPSMSYSGGGVYCFEATPTIRGNIIRENKADNPESGSWGGGVYIGFPFAVQQPEPTIVEYNVIEDNYASHNGGGIAIQAECIVQGNLIRGNRTGRGDGGGIYYNSSSPNILITDNTLVGNTANDHGGGRIYRFQGTGQGG